jgi:hypothetical protein
MRTERPSIARNLAPGETPSLSASARKRGPAAAENGDWNIAGRARSFRLEEGLYALTVGATDTSGASAGELALPATCIAPAPAEDGLPVTVITRDEFPGWVGAEGGAVVVKVPPGGGSVLVTAYGVAEDARLPQIHILDIDSLGKFGNAAIPAAAPPRIAAGREIASELILHIERHGDRRFPSQGWAGNPGQRLRVEGFAIRPLQIIAPGDLEYMAHGPGGRQTPWVTDAKLCGTRGRGLPLTGFAIRLAARLRDRFDVVYEGYFFDSGVIGPARNGEPCQPAAIDDPLAALRLRVIERAGV